MNRKEKYSSRSAGFVDHDLKTDAHDEIMLWLDVEGAFEYVSNRYPKSKISQKIWEAPIQTFNLRNGYVSGVLGYVDMFCALSTNEEHFDFESSDSDDFDYKYIDEHVRGCIFFEVKSKINSIGEVIRQIRQYQSYLCQGNTLTRHTFGNVREFVIVSPDDRFKDVLESQGIKFLKYEK